jgi:divalent metal cation (Fe/Co/Zn/Cd) transporter
VNTNSSEKATGFHDLSRTALILSVITILYNIAEGAVSLFFGVSDDTLALSGFGLDSFVEVMSGLGIAHMILRTHGENVTGHDRFERIALYITGSGFFLLAAGLVIGAVINTVMRKSPDTTIAGIIISSVSIITMWFLYRKKLSTGIRLGSEAIISDAMCTKTCFYLSLVLLASSLVYEIWGVGYVDAAGALGIAWFSFSEGREAIEKARTGSLTCSCRCGSGGCSH